MFFFLFPLIYVRMDQFHLVTDIFRLLLLLFTCLILVNFQSEDESQEVQISVRYPRRSFSVVSDYHLKDTLLEGTADINWSLHEENKTVRLEGRWFNPDLPDKSLHDFKLSLMHPSFSKVIFFSFSTIICVYNLGNCLYKISD